MSEAYFSTCEISELESRCMVVAESQFHLLEQNKYADLLEVMIDHILFANKLKLWLNHNFVILSLFIIISSWQKQY